MFCKKAINWQKTIITGSVYSEDFYSAYHIISNNPKDLSRLMGSKYFQSDTEGIYSKVKQILDDNKEVLFTGTPCQVWALKEYLGIKYENLYTVDLLCRGVPSPKMHMKKIQSYEEKAKSRVREFRDKSKYEGPVPRMHTMHPRKAMNAIKD